MRRFGALVLALGAIALTVLAVIYLIKGGVWIAENVLPWLLPIAMYVLAFLPISLLLAIFPSQRDVAGLFLYIYSLIFGTTLWLTSIWVTYTYWGVIGVAIGVFLFGIGIVPLAAIAALFNGNWSMLGVLLLGTLLTFGCRYGGMLLIAYARGHESDHSGAQHRR